VLAERVAGVVFLATAPVVPLPIAVQRAMRAISPTMERIAAKRGYERMPRYPMDRGDLPYVLSRRAFGRSPSHTHIELTRQLVAATPPATTFPSGLGLVTHDAEEALQATKTPAMVIGGELDTITPPAMSHRIAHLLDDCELHIFEHAGHQLMLERPTELAELLDKFAARLG
jgi:pimeloyl-ACP methyl ester carboxylesterase